MFEFGSWSLELFECFPSHPMQSFPKVVAARKHAAPCSSFFSRWVALLLLMGSILGQPSFYMSPILPFSTPCLIPGHCLFPAIDSTFHLLTFDKKYTGHSPASILFLFSSFQHSALRACCHTTSRFCASHPTQVSLTAFCMWEATQFCSFDIFKYLSLQKRHPQSEVKGQFLGIYKHL